MIKCSKILGLFMVVVFCMLVTTACSKTEDVEESNSFTKAFSSRTTIATGQNEVRRGENIIYVGSKSSNDGFKEISFDFNDLKR